jgi:hypothetical protein
MTFYEFRLHLGPSSEAPLQISFRDFSSPRTNSEFKIGSTYKLCFCLLVPLPCIRDYFDGIPMVRFTRPVIEAYANETKVSN